jgi:two-component system CheB/CheR fusion protein
MKLLLVEDHPAVARISCDLLRDVHGHDVEHAATGVAALAAATLMTPEIVLIDLNLPDMNGYELAARLRAQPQFERTLLVALTGFGNVVDSERAAAAGIDAHFRKPMKFELLPGLKRAAAPV